MCRGGGQFGQKMYGMLFLFSLFLSIGLNFQIENKDNKIYFNINNKEYDL